AVLLAAELLFIHYLPEADTGSDHKRRSVSTVLGWRDADTAIPDELAAGFENGIAAYGAAKTQRDRYLRFLLQFCQEIKVRGFAERRQLLHDPWALRGFVAGLGRPNMQSEALLHMIHPDVFESVLAPDTKQLIAQRFAEVPGVEEAVDVDAKLLVVRHAL